MEGLLAPWHIAVVLLVAVLVFGPQKLPEIGRQVGRGLHELRKFRASLDEDLRGFMGSDDHPGGGDEVPTLEARSPSPGQQDLPRRGAQRPPLPESGD